MTVIHVKNPQDPRVRRTRKLLEQAFQSLLQEKGFQSVTVQDIAERAEVNRATFYAHFDDKYNLLDTMMRERFREQLDARFAETSSVTADSLLTMCLTIFEFLDGVFHSCRRDEQIGPTLEAAVHDVLSAFISDRLNTCQPPAAALGDSETTAQVIASTLIGTGSWWSQGDRRLPAEELARRVVAILMHGVAGALQGNATVSEG